MQTILLFELGYKFYPLDMFTIFAAQIIFDNILNRKIPWPPVPKDMSTEAQNLIDRYLIYDFVKHFI